MAQPMNGARLATTADILTARMARPIAGVPRDKWLTDKVKGQIFIAAKLSAGWCILPSPENRLLPQWLGAVLQDTDTGDEQPSAPPEPNGITIMPPKRKGRPPGSKNKGK